MILEFERPVSLAASTARFTRWGDDPVNAVFDGAFHRVIRTGGGPAAYRAHQTSPTTIDIDGPPEAASDLRWRLAEALPAEPLVEVAAGDPRVQALIDDHPGYRPPMEPDPFEALVQAVTAQQVNLQWAVTTRRRLVEAFAEPVRAFGRTLWPFPTAEVLAAVEADRLRELQFTWRKAEYIIGIAQHCRAGTLDGLAAKPDDEVIALLIGIRGVGRWTADWILARCLARPNAVAAGDLGVRKAISHHWLCTDELLDEADVRAAAGEWGDAANWITHLLLERLANP